MIANNMDVSDLGEQAQLTILGVRAPENWIKACGRTIL